MKAAPVLLVLMLAGFGLAGCNTQGPKIEIPVGEGTVEAGPAAPNRAPLRRPASAATEAKEADKAETAEVEAAEADAKAIAEAEAKSKAEADVEAVPDTPEIEKTAEHKACEKRGGRYLSLKGSTARACFITPKDAGKSCKKSGDCTTKCLARSRTCAPVSPLFGCHDILTEAGTRVTECLE